MHGNEPEFDSRPEPQRRVEALLDDIAAEHRRLPGEGYGKVMRSAVHISRRHIGVERIDPMTLCLLLASALERLEG